MTINSKEQPVVKKVKRSSSTITNSVSPPKQKRTTKKLSTYLTSNNQVVAVVNKKAITGLIGEILLVVFTVSTIVVAEFVSDFVKEQVLCVLYHS